jgi:hypothetical protein
MYIQFVLDPFMLLFVVVINKTLVGLQKIKLVKMVIQEIVLKLDETLAGAKKKYHWRLGLCGSG